MVAGIFQREHVKMLTQSKFIVVNANYSGCRATSISVREMNTSFNVNSKGLLVQVCCKQCSSAIFTHPLMSLLQHLRDHFLLGYLEQRLHALLNMKRFLAAGYSQRRLCYNEILSLLCEEAHELQKTMTDSKLHPKRSSWVYRHGHTRDIRLYGRDTM